MKTILIAGWTAAMLLAWQSPCVKAQQAAGVGAQSAAAAATAPRPAEVSSQPTGSPKASLADFAWLEGRWRGEWGPRIAEQSWFAPKAGVMTGQFRLVENDKALVIELFTMVEKPETISLYIRHFTPELVPWEKTGATVLELSSVDAKRAEFENPANGLPKRAVLVRVDADTYLSRSEIIPDEGEPQIVEITYHRQKPTPEKPNAGSGARR